MATYIRHRRWRRRSRRRGRANRACRGLASAIAPLRSLERRSIFPNIAASTYAPTRKRRDSEGVARGRGGERRGANERRTCSVLGDLTHGRQVHVACAIVCETSRVPSWARCHGGAVVACIPAATKIVDEVSPKPTADARKSRRREHVNTHGGSGGDEARVKGGGGRAAGAALPREPSTSWAAACTKGGPRDTPNRSTERPRSLNRRGGVATCEGKDHDGGATRPRQFQKWVTSASEA